MCITAFGRHHTEVVAVQVQYNNPVDMAVQLVNKNLVTATFKSAVSALAHSNACPCETHCETTAQDSDTVHVDVNAKASDI